jgi:iron complex transport system ATP-binding protein
MNSGSVLKLESVDLVRNENQILKSVSLSIDLNEHLVIVGPNGAGKSSLIDIAAGYQFPTRGYVEILGKTLGKTDLAELKLSIGYVGPRIELMMDPQEKVFDAVISAAYAIVGRWRESYSEVDINRAEAVLNQLGMKSFSDREFGSLSAGEKKKVEIARALMNDPELLILDEPAASLDLPAREDLLQQLNNLINSGFSPSILMVTHHIEEIASGFTNALLLKEGKVIYSGGIDDVITESNLSELFGAGIRLVQNDGRRFAYRKT